MTKPEGYSLEERVAIFVDGDYVTAAFRVDARALFQEVAQGRPANLAVWRASYTDEADRARKAKFFQALEHSGFVVGPVARKPNGNGSYKSRLDAFLMADMFQRLLAEELGQAPLTPTWILVSGDSDFEPVLRLLKERGRRVEVAHLQGLSKELREVADALIDLQGAQGVVERKPHPESANICKPPSSPALALTLEIAALKVRVNGREVEVPL